MSDIVKPFLYDESLYVNVASVFQAVCGSDWLRAADLLDAGHHHLLRYAGNAEPRLARCAPHRRHFPLRVHGAHCRLLRRPPLQDHEGQGVEGM